MVATRAWFSPAVSAVHLLLGQANGTLSAPIAVPYGTSASRVASLAVDLDGDGVDEVVLGHDGGLAILRRMAAGWSVTSHALAASDMALASVDVNRDGHPDLASLGFSGPVNLFVTDGAGGIASMQTLASGGGSWRDLEAADLDGNGTRDLVVTHRLGLAGSAYVHLHNGRNGFAAPGVLPMPRGTPAAVALGDVDGDELPDVVLADHSNSPVNLYPFLRRKEGFVAGTPIASHDLPSTLSILDLDGNGLADIATAHGGWSRMGSWLQSRAGLAPEALWAIPYASTYHASSGLAFGDLLGNDGCPDAAIADYNAGLVLLRGRDCVGADLKMSVEQRGANLVFAVDNGSTSTAAVRPLVRISLRRGSGSVIGRRPSVPPACQPAPAPSTLANFDCLLPDLAADASGELVFAHWSAHVSGGSAEVSSPTRDPDPSNNAATLPPR